mgnify:CR=1 FL=1
MFRYSATSVSYHWGIFQLVCVSFLTVHIIASVAYATHHYGYIRRWWGITFLHQHEPQHTEWWGVRFFSHDYEEYAIGFEAVDEASKAEISNMDVMQLDKKGKRRNNRRGSIIKNLGVSDDRAKIERLRSSYFARRRD